jgi:transposase
VTDKDGHDALQFIPVMEATRKNFDVKEVSADKAYGSMKHSAYSEMHGIDSYIPFKENVTADSRDATAVWKRMYHFFALNRAEFIQHYNIRSNAETTFHMIKSKFGGLLKSKTFEAQKNEALCKVICHNICCLIHAINEFGIEI